MNDSEKKELNELLQRLIQIKSVNPPGNEKEVASFIIGFSKEEINRFILRNNWRNYIVKKL